MVSALQAGIHHLLGLCSVIFHIFLAKSVGTLSSRKAFSTPGRKLTYPCAVLNRVAILRKFGLKVLNALFWCVMSEKQIFVWCKKSTGIEQKKRTDDN